MKFGGTSVADIDRIRAVRDIISGEVKDGWNVVAVVSAMSKETNKLIDLAKQVGVESLVDPEYDSLKRILKKKTEKEIINKNN